MLNKTKAAMPGRSCHCIKLKHIQNNTLIDHVNRCNFHCIAKFFKRLKIEGADFIQFFGSKPRCFSSFRMMRFIQADMDSSPSLSIAVRMDCSNSGSTRKAICLLPRGKFVFDTCCTLGLACLCQTMYNTSLSYAKQQRPAVLPALTGRLTTMLLELTLWLISSLPKLAPNFSIAFLRWAFRLKVSFTSSPQPNVKHGNTLLMATLWFLLVACLFRGDAMFDNTPLELEEVIDQCRALAYAIVELSNPEAKEILTFVLAERLNSLHQAFQASETEVGHV